MTPWGIVLGPPGTGKTTALLGCVDEEFARGVPPDRVGYISFTKRAATEAVTRACKKFNIDKKELRYFRTIHSLCFSVLGLSSGDVLEGKKLLEFGDWLGMPISEFSGWSDEGSTFGFQPADRALFMENLARVRCLPLRAQYEEDSDGLPWSMVDKVSRGLAQYKRDTGLVDYTDMLEQFVAQEYAPPLEALFVDEAQDLSLLQWRVVGKLAARARRVVVAGDDDQAIYRWAGAATAHFVALPGDERVLGQSHRCPAVVQALAAGIAGRIPAAHRRAKKWAPRPGEGDVVRVGGPGAVDWSGDDILVLVRNAYVARDHILPLLRTDGIIYEWRGHNSVRPSVLEAVLAWERLRRGEAVFPDEARRAYAMMTIGRGVTRGFKTLPRVPEEQPPVDLAWLRAHGGLLTDSIWHEALDAIPPQERDYMLRALKIGEKLRARPRVRVSTIHGAKGGEADRVVLMTDVAPRTRAEAVRNPDDEARVFYVAVTRAARSLTIVAPRGPSHYDV